jgi:hypothetical protein
MLLVLIVSIPALAQQNTTLFDQLTEKYADTEGFSANLITSDMFDLYIKKRNIEESSPVFDALKKLDRIMVISQSNFFSKTAGQTVNETAKNNEKDQVHAAILDYYKKGGYTLLKTEKRMGEDVKVFVKKSQEKTNALALITNSSFSASLVELQGDIDLKTVGELNKALNMKGLENLYKIDSNSQFYGFTTGTAFSPEKIEEYAAQQGELARKHSQLSKEQQAAIEDQARAMAEKQMVMAKKYQEMSEKYGREPIFLSYPGDTNTVYYIDGKKTKAKEIKELDKSKIESVEINKAEKEGDKTTVKIKTKK